LDIQLSIKLKDNRDEPSYGYPIHAEAIKILETMIVQKYQQFHSNEMVG
jgi:hypothetical protein